MGIAKRMWEEKLDRGYNSNDGLTVCSDCFDDPGIKQFIVEHQSHNSWRKARNIAMLNGTDEYKAMGLANILDVWASRRDRSPTEIETGM
jgi:hypothetical protein